jgi:FixJ family two-component response regulator
MFTSAKSDNSVVNSRCWIGKVRNKRSHIAIVDDDEDVREAIGGLVRSVGFAAATFPSAIEFLRSPEVERTACLIADINMPEMSGFDLFFRLSILGNAIPTIFITAFPTDNDRSRALDAGIVSYLAKPFGDAELLDGISIALARGSTGR